MAQLQNFKRILLFIAVAFMVHHWSAEANAEIRIGVLAFSEEMRYLDSLRGIMEQLKEDGFAEPEVKYIIENANGSKAKAAELVQLFAAAKMDLIIPVGTSASIAVSREIKDVPIVFSMVFDPIEAGIAREWEDSGNNTTGSSTKIPMSKLLNFLREFAPVKRLAVLYTPGEKNTELQLKELQEMQTESKIAIIPVILTTKEEVAPALSALLRTVDAVYLTGSNIVGASVPLIVDAANKAKVVTITHLDDLVEKGVLLGICTNSYLVGRLAGIKAILVLKGTKPSDIPIEFDQKPDLIFNKKTAVAGHFQIPPSFLKKVTKIIE